MKYEAPETLQEALGLLSQDIPGTHILAGGTDLLVQLRSELIEPERIVDIKKIGELRTIGRHDEGWLIGAAVPAAEVGEHAELKAAWPGVVEALELIGSTQIQGRATFGGNICNGSPAADSVPALIAAGARAVVAGASGERDIPIEELITGPGEIALSAGELLVSIKLPSIQPRTGDAYLRFIPRTEMDIAVVGAGVCLELDGEGRISKARMGLGAVAERPLLVEEAAAVLVGSKPDEATLDRLDGVARQATRPIDDKRGTKDFRTKVAGVLARRACAIAYERAESR
ncbi:MAG: FAD binding domain-containing protein [Methyloligellaceae bacterium]